MTLKKISPDQNKLAQIVSEARRSQELREQSYRGQALKLYPWICGRCNAILANRRTLEIVGGAFLIVAALVVVGIRLPRVLSMERRLSMGKGGTLATSGLAGVAFAIGWSPCIGPTLGAILTLSLGTSSGPADGAILLAAYSLGLGLPFLVAGLAFTRALGVAGWVRSHWRVVSIGSAALLAGFGGLLISGELFRLTQQLSRFTGWQI
jgi:cytochrome c-type biogenesis protein